jgi:hypothetical protein
MACAVAGFLTFLVPQFVLIVLSAAPLPDNPGWFLNAGGNVRIIGIAVGVVAAVVAFLQAGRVLGSALTFAAGVIWAMLVTLFAIGPGNLFPIVIAIGGTVIAAAVTIGTVAGLAVRLTLGLVRHAAKRVG